VSVLQSHWRELSAALAVIFYLLLCVCVLWRFRQQHPRRQALQAGGILLAYASQGGEAERIARYSAAQFSGHPAITLLPLSQVDEAALGAASLALFVVSTYGEGEPPDNGVAFDRRVLARPDLSLPALRFAVLALGDSEYRHFCAFGERVFEKLSVSGAENVTPLLKADRSDVNTLDQWQHQLAALGAVNRVGADELPASFQATEPVLNPWRLVRREKLNSHHSGGLGSVNPVFLLEFIPDGNADLADWQAGDLAEIIPYNDTEQLRRQYSIASVPAERRLLLLIRLHLDEHGKAGVASGWLCGEINVGECVQLAIRKHEIFHGPAADVPMILIGNGTGIAGLRSHLAQRENQRAAADWLLWGERSRAHDFYFHEQVQHWKISGRLARLNTVFSRDGGPHRYVQDCLATAGTELQHWLARGAAIYVCGSREGMAQGVDQVLRQQLGDNQVDQLLADGRYRRDVY